MSKFSIDLTNLEKLNKKTYRLSDIKNRLEKVAFDLYRFKDAENKDELWEVQQCEDGEFIVAKYQDEDANVKTATASAKSPWSVLVSESSNINIFYKDFPVVKLAASKIGISESDLPVVSRSLPEKLATNSQLRKALLKEINQNIREELLKKYPEIA